MLKGGGNGRLHLFHGRFHPVEIIQPAVDRGLKIWRRWPGVLCWCRWQWRSVVGIAQHPSWACQCCQKNPYYMYLKGDGSLKSRECNNNAAAVDGRWIRKQFLLAPKEWFPLLSMACCGRGFCFSGFLERRRTNNQTNKNERRRRRGLPQPAKYQVEGNPRRTPS